MDVRGGYSCRVLCAALDMVLPGHGISRTEQVTGEREATGMIKKSYLLNCVESMMCLDQFMLNEGKGKREQDTVLSVCQMVMKRVKIS